MNEHRQIQFIVFSDIMYGVVIGVGVNFLIHIIDSLSLNSIILLLWAYFLICDDWFGAHYMASHYSYSVLIFLIDIMLMLDFVFLIYFASKASIHIFLPIVIYPLLSFFWDSAYISICKGFSEEQKVLRIWRAGSVVLFAVYGILMGVLYVLKVDNLSLKQAAFTVWLWLAWRVVLTIVTHYKVRKII
ncbi:MAG: hypothetical protein WBF13_10245 [Candidatus Zixiibacteriota bacterium]